jgi:hypothetical protein
MTSDPIRVRVAGDPLVWTVTRVGGGPGGRVVLELAAAGRRRTALASEVRRVDESPWQEAPT